MYCRRQPLAPVVPESYRFYALPVEALLKLEEWEPHQRLLGRGLLVDLTEQPTDTEVIFISHQWTSFNHPDPTGTQLRALQNVLRKLMAGEMGVRTNCRLEGIYQVKLVTESGAWKRMLPGAYVWIDYMCMPQPYAGGKVPTMSDHRVLEASPEPIRSTCAGIEQRELTKQLRAAVDSIPAYVRLQRESNSQSPDRAPSLLTESTDPALRSSAARRCGCSCPRASTPTGRGPRATSSRGASAAGAAWHNIAICDAMRCYAVLC
jgi:hypothetical protein